MRKLLLVAVAAALPLVAAGCGEKPTVTVYKQGQYQGKPDTKPWDNDPGASLYTSSKWTRGDKTSWETALKSRTLAQNEYTRAE